MFPLFIIIYKCLCMNSACLVCIIFMCIALLTWSNTIIYFQTFKYFCYDITDDGLVRMLRVIKKDLKPARHQDTDTDDDDDNDLLDIEDEEEPDEDEINETAESDEQADDSEAVVGAEVASTELPDASDDSDDSDEGMDDDAMFRMDSYLARIFKERKNQVGGETAQSQLVLFKLRVLSLLEIYLHENPGKYQVYITLSLTYISVKPLHLQCLIFI